jgi:hypothetical protein
MRLDYFLVRGGVLKATILLFRDVLRNYSCEKKKRPGPFGAQGELKPGRYPSIYDKGIHDKGFGG